MQYDAETPEEYLTLLKDDWRKEKLMSIHQMITDNAPELEESIRYKMLNYGKKAQDDYIFALNAQKHYVSLYVGSIAKIDPECKMLADFNLGKGCVRVRKTIDLKETHLEEFIQQTVDLWRDGKNVYC